MAHFGDRLAEAVERRSTPAMVGIDPRPDALPRGIVERYGLGPGASPRLWARAVEEYCSRVLDIVASWVPVLKFQSAFFELHGAAGVASLRILMHKAHQLGLVVILDGKRGDIGTTSAAYAEAAFDGQAAVRGGASRAVRTADALTVNPYLGKDSLEPFLKFTREAGRGLFVLVRTSNPGSRDLQHLTCVESNQAVYRRVADWVREWSETTRGRSGYGSVGAVVGGTAGESIGELRAVMPSAWLLIPGYGTQGATAADVAPAFDERGRGAIVNNSRGILSPNIEGDPNAPGAWESAVETALKGMIDDLARNTPAGRLRSSATAISDR